MTTPPSSISSSSSTSQHTQTSFPPVESNPQATHNKNKNNLKVINYWLLTLLHYNRIGYYSIRLERDGLKSSRKESQPICTQKGNVAAAVVMDNILHLCKRCFMFCRDREKSLELCFHKYNYVVTYYLCHISLLFIRGQHVSCIL